MVTHDPVAAAYTDRVVFLADGRIVDELRRPDREQVLDKMQELADARPAPGGLRCSASPGATCSPASSGCCCPPSRSCSAWPSSRALIFTDAMGGAFDDIIEGSTPDVEVAFKGANDFDSVQDNRTMPGCLVDELEALPEVGVGPPAEHPADGLPRSARTARSSAATARRDWP